MNEPTPTFIRKDPPTTRKAPTPWRAIMRKLRDTPDEWFVIATDVSPSVVTHLKRRYNVEARTSGASMDGTKAAELYAKWVTDQSSLDYEGEPVRFKLK